jgi:D-lyxose ketol-isomerase
VLTTEQKTFYRNKYLVMLRQANVVVKPEEAAELEMPDFGLRDFESEGLGIIVYVNTDRYCAKELMMLPRQTCPQHRHPSVGGAAGKMETFRCRWGKVFLYVDGAGSVRRACNAPAGKERFYTAEREIVLTPGEQFTIPPDTWHWFQAGPDGAVVSEFSSTSRDEHDIFADPAIVRVEPVRETLLTRVANCFASLSPPSTARQAG